MSFPTAANPFSRRSFLQRAAGAVAAVALNGRPRTRADEAQTFPAGSIIDAHTHFYDPTRPEGVPWPGKEDKVLYRRVLPAEFKALTRPYHVTGTVVVEASRWVEDNQWLLDLADREPFLLGVVGRLTPGGDDYRKNLRRFSRNPLFRGIRINSDELRTGLDQKRFLEDLALLADGGLELDANGSPDLLPLAARLAKRLPALTVVINHAANVPIGGKAARPDWLAGIKSAAQGTRVYCKVSALVEATGRPDGKAPAVTEYYQPVLDALWENFGDDRLIYASNWPVSERFATYGTVFGIVRKYVQTKGQACTDKFFAGNAVAAYRLKNRGGPGGNNE